MVETYRYDDFGNPETVSSLGNPYGFQGRRYDHETELYYFRNRMYDAATGRFLQRDPVWDKGNFGGWYTFAGNGPVSRVDFMGLQQQANPEREAERRRIADMTREIQRGIAEMARPWSYWSGGDDMLLNQKIHIRDRALKRYLGQPMRSEHEVYVRAMFRAFVESGENTFRAFPPTGIAISATEVASGTSFFSGREVSRFWALVEGVALAVAMKVYLKSKCPLSPMRPTRSGARLSKDEVEELSRLRAQNKLGRKLSKTEGPDWVDIDTGLTYDQMGNPSMIPHWNKERPQFFRQIDEHLLKADHTVIDLVGFPRKIINEVQAYIDKLPPNDRGRIITIGF